MRSRKIEINFTEADSLEELNSKDAMLISRAREAAENAWAPYSKFNVGAAVLLENGTVVLGNNQENAAYPSGLCAERVALFSANANYPNVAVNTIAISARTESGLVKEAVKPCGSCRQAILESEIRFEQPIRMLLDSAQKIYIIDSIKTLLPLSFGKESLEG